jgi:predicted ATP-dependent endonuclease of OLD family
MIIESLQIKNFRSILSETLHCENLTALVGANGAGKSSLLKALDLFYNPTLKIDREDFYNGDNSKEISVTITFKDLSEKAQEQFASYLQDGKLSVERIFAWEENKIIWKYHGSILKDPNLKAVREGLMVKDRGATAKAEYEKVRSLPGYESLAAWPRRLDEAQEILKKWESEHPSSCTRERDEGQFFGFKEVAQGYLGRYTRFLYIPAVRDASDDSIEGRNTVFTSLMDLVVRSVLANKKELKELQEATQERFKEIMNPANLTELSSLAESMTTTLKTFVPEAKVDLLWQALSDVSLPFPQADIKLVEDGYSSAIHRTGHGLQRAFILTMLQHLVMAQAAAEAVPKEGEDQRAEKGRSEEKKLPDLVIAIEEPEIYQHPNRQRHLANILMKLAEGKTPGVAEKTQILYSTHAPLFVGIDRINQIRLLRKMPNEDKPKITKIISTNTDKVAEEIWKAEGESGSKYAGRTMLPRLQTIMTPWMSEGFFADVAVLVEGEE